MQRRTLTFASLTDAVHEAEGMLANGYIKVGSWSLGQLCGHLANWLTYPIDGFPRMPLILRPVMWTLRNTIGRRQFDAYLRNKAMPPGKPTIPQSVPPADGNDAAAVASFIQAVDQLLNYDGPFHPSPLFGLLTKEELLAIHCVHTAHHLSFLVPKQV